MSRHCTVQMESGHVEPASGPLGSGAAQANTISTGIARKQDMPCTMENNIQSLVANGPPAR